VPPPADWIHRAGLSACGLLLERRARWDAPGPSRPFYIG
jgi:hypothetical protein